MSDAQQQPLPDGVPEVRIGDAERDRVIRDLQAHYRDGRLGLGEFEDRVEQVAAARTASQLDHVLVDLPVLQDGQPVTTQPASTVVTGSDTRSGLSVADRNAVVRLAVLSVFFVVLWAVTSGVGSHFWPIYPILGIGMGTAFQVFSADEDDDTAES